MNIAALILAAGKSSRMGKSKQLLPWLKNTLLGHAIEVANNASIEKVFVVLGSEAERIQETLAPGNYDVILNHNWKDGLGSSISVGTQGIVSSGPTPDAILIMLADQPFVDATYIDTLIGHFKKSDKKIIATKYGSKLGVPAIFDNAYFSALQDLKGDEGAGSLIAKNKTTSFGVDPGKKVIDLDTPKDYATYQRLNSKNKT